MYVVVKINKLQKKKHTVYILIPEAGKSSDITQHSYMCVSSEVCAFIGQY